MHSGMQASVLAICPTFRVSNGLKQGCVLASFLFNLYFNKAMQDALDSFKDGFQAKYKLGANVFGVQGPSC